MYILAPQLPEQYIREISSINAVLKGTLSIFYCTYIGSAPVFTALHSYSRRFVGSCGCFSRTISTCHRNSTCLCTICPREQKIQSFSNAISVDLNAVLCISTAIKMLMYVLYRFLSTIKIQMCDENTNKRFIKKLSIGLLF